MCSGEQLWMSTKRLRKSKLSRPASLAGSSRLMLVATVSEQPSERVLSPPPSRLSTDDVWDEHHDKHDHNQHQQEWHILFYNILQ